MSVSVIPTRQAQQNPDQAGQTQEIPLTVKVVRSVGNDLELKTASEALKKRMTIPTLRGSRPNTRSDHATKIEATVEKDGGIANPHHLASQKTAPVMEDTGSQGRKDTSGWRKTTYPYPGPARMWIRATRVWFDELPPESIDGYKGLKAAFLAYFMQQKKYVKDPVEIHNIKQRDGETIEEFMERFKIETERMKGALECMRISEFMHGVNNPELTKLLNEHVPKTMEEMMTVTTAFIRGEAAAASKKKGH
ncbi:reverse transcriptase domain-containing protein [Tanacetum coccineum]